MKFEMEDGAIVNTDLAIESWDEDTNWNGNNHISVATGSQWEHETLYLSRKGRYYVVHTSQWQGSLPSCRWLTKEKAATWLLANGREIPDDLKSAAKQIEE